MGKILNPRALILRGVLSIVFGIAMLAWPGPGLLAIALLYGAYAFVDGIMAFASGVRRERRHESWGLPILQGVLGIGIGVVTLIWPGITLFALSVLVGVWALLLGVLEIVSAFKLHLASKGSRVLLGIAGALSVILGLAIFGRPPVGAVALLTLVAMYSILAGVILTWMGVRLRREPSIVERLEQQFPKAA